MTTAEHRVLEALRVLDRSAQLEHAEAWHENVERFLHGFDSIKMGVEVVTNGRRSSERQIYDALHKLVAAGKVEKSKVGGMGGSFSVFIRVPS